MADPMTLGEAPLELPEDNRFVTWTDWSGYLKFLDAIGERRLRTSYDRGKLEIMTPSPQHEGKKSLLGCLLECLMLERGIDFRLGGATTLKRQDLDRGLEPDECYWIDNWRSFGDDYDPQRDPAPDLVIEVEVSRSAVSRMGIYQALGVPEVWRFGKRGLSFWVRDLEGRYQRRERSPRFPDLDPDWLRDFLDARQDLSTTALLRDFRVWLNQGA